MTIASNATGPCFAYGPEPLRAGLPVRSSPGCHTYSGRPDRIGARRPTSCRTGMTIASNATGPCFCLMARSTLRPPRTAAITGNAPGQKISPGSNADAARIAQPSEAAASTRNIRVASRRSMARAWGRHDRAPGPAETALQAPRKKSATAVTHPRHGALSHLKPPACARPPRHPMVLAGQVYTGRDHPCVPVPSRVSMCSLRRWP
jgi:hypothetical protein